MLVPPKPEANGHPDRAAIVETLARTAEPAGTYRIADLPSERCWEPAGQENHSDGDVEELHASLDKHGQMVPAIAGERDDMPGHYWVYDGNARLAWARERRKPLRAVLLDHTPDESEIITIRVTTGGIKKGRNGAAFGFDILRWQMLNNANQAATAEHFGFKTSSAISKLTKPFKNGLEELVEALKNRKIAATSAALVASLPHEAQRQILPDILERRLPRKRVKGIVDGFKKKKAKAKQTKIVVPGATTIVTGNLIESLKALMMKSKEVIVYLERNPNARPEMIAALMS